MLFNRWIAAAITALALAGCGARTGLRTADAHRDDALDAPDDAVDGSDVTDALDALDATDAIDVRDVPTDEGGLDVVDACVVANFTLTERSAEVMFVIDRSGSMAFDLEGREGGSPQRWDVLRNALATALPPFQTAMDTGAYFFPAELNSSFSRPCMIASAIDVLPGRGNASRIVDVFDTTAPFGATPTVDALDFAGRFLATRVTRSHQAAIVLATDGGPNCNRGLDPRTCTCTGTDEAGNPTCRAMSDFCLDDARAVETVTRLASTGVPTYVVGIDDPMHPEYTHTLNEMAIAGGHPLSGTTNFYSIRSAAALVEAFTAIQQSIARCSFVLPAPAVDPDRVGVQIGAFLEPRDPGHMNGWDWTSPMHDEITLYGSACERAIASGSSPSGAVLCTGP